MNPSKDEMVPETVFAYRFPEQEGWEIQAWECTRDQLQKEIELVGWKLEDMRVICEHQIRKGLNGYFTGEYAMRGHWLRSHEGNWYPMDEAPPMPDGTPQYASIEIALLAIHDGWLEIQIESNATIITMSLDPAFDDQLDFVRFTNLVMAGKHPHIVFINHDVVALSIHPHDVPGLVRFRMRRTASQDEFTLIDVAIPRKSLVAKMRALLRDIANHPSFGHEWLCFGELPENLTEKFEAEAEAIWEQKYGKSADDNWLEERDFIGHYIAERVPLPKDRMDYVERECRAMRTLDLSEFETAQATHLKDGYSQKHSSAVQPYSEEEYREQSNADRQGTFYKIAYRISGKDGWKIENFIQDIPAFLKKCSRDEEDVIEHRIVSEFLGRPAYHGTVFFGHKGELGQNGWVRDRYADCWRAPGEVVAKPDWSIPLHVIQEREANLCFMAPIAAEVILEVFAEEDTPPIFKEVRHFDGARISRETYNHFNWGVADYLIEKNVLTDRVGKLLAVWRREYDICNNKIIFGEFHRHLIGGAKDWKVEGAKSPDRPKPLINLYPDYSGAYAWDEHGTCIGLDYIFPNCSDVALVEGELEDMWQPLFEMARENPDTGELDLDWKAFHSQGRALALRLKAIVGEQADIVYSKPYEDPDQEHDKLLFIVPKEWAQ